MFRLYKDRGARWSAIAHEIPGRTENEVKNRFYSTLRRVATKKAQERSSKFQYRKATLLQFVDEALEYGHTCSSKRGRKKKHIEEPDNEQTFKPFAVPSPPPTATTTAALNSDRRPTMDPKLQQALQRLVLFQGNCISMLKQKIIESMAAGSAFRPYTRPSQLSLA